LRGEERAGRAEESARERGKKKFKHQDSCRSSILIKIDADQEIAGR